MWIVCPACHQRSGVAVPMTPGLKKTYECEVCGQVWEVAQPPPVIEGSARPTVRAATARGAARKRKKRQAP